MSSHTRSEIFVSFGFAASFFIAFLVTMLAPESMTWLEIGAVWTVAVSAGFINHGIWDRSKGMMVGGFLSVATTVVSLAFEPTYMPLGYVVLGCSIAISSYYSTGALGPESLVGVYSHASEPNIKNLLLFCQGV